MRDLPPHIKKLPARHFDLQQELRDHYALEDQREQVFEVSNAAARRGMCFRDRLQMLTAACCYPGQGGIQAMKYPVVSHSRRAA